MRPAHGKKKRSTTVRGGQLLPALLVTAGLILLSRKRTLEQLSAVRRQLKASYTPAEAEKAIGAVMERYRHPGDRAFFEDCVFHIDGSWRVLSRRDRLLVCEILSRTEGFTGRTARNLSAEWLGHNVVTYATLGRKRSAVDVDLDGNGDARPCVARLSRLMERFWMA